MAISPKVFCQNILYSHIRRYWADDTEHLHVQCIMFSILRILHRSARSKCCNGVQYFNRKQECCEGKVINSSSHYCCDGVVKAQDGHFCCGIFTFKKSPTASCCQSKIINSETQGMIIKVLI